MHRFNTTAVAGRLKFVVDHRNTHKLALFSFLSGQFSHGRPVPCFKPLDVIEFRLAFRFQLQAFLDLIQLNVDPVDFSTDQIALGIDITNNKN